jgi:DNA-binding NtrC family response regulator
MNATPHETLTGLEILIVEDEALLRKQLTAQLERLGMDVTGTGTLSGARQLVSEMSFDFALLDVNLPDGRGTDLLRESAFSPNTGVVVMTANGEVAGAVEAMRLGALDYVVKPFDPLELPLVMNRVRRSKQSTRAAEHRREDEPGFFFGSALRDLETQLRRILAADARMQGPLPPVLIQGDTGTGKTTIGAFHQPAGSDRRPGNDPDQFRRSQVDPALVGHDELVIPSALAERRVPGGRRTWDAAREHQRSELVRGGERHDQLAQ